MTKILDGTALSNQMILNLKEKIEGVIGRKPKLSVLLVGAYAASLIYVARKEKACLLAGIEFEKKEFAETISEEALLKEVRKLNEDPLVDGILVQCPLPLHIKTSKIMEAIHPMKDVDGFHPLNLGGLVTGTSFFTPCTPLGIRTLLEHYNLSFAGKKAVVLGRSVTVGKPMALLLMQDNPFANASVSLLHSRSQDILTYTKQADLIIAAIGKPLFLKKEMVKEGAVVVDVGINSLFEEGKKKIVGDVDFKGLYPHVSYISKVPGGVGPMTVASLLENTWKAFQRNYV